jgi:glycosyltransferase involved in cell wall biosynthesis
MARAMGQMKILYVVSELDDFFSSRLPVALAAKGDGHKISIAAPGAHKSPHLSQLGFQGYDIPAPDQKLSGASAFKLVRRIDDILHEAKPDIIHAITLKYAFLAGLAARRYKKIKPVYTIAGLGYLFSSETLKPKLMRLLLRPIIRNVFRNARIIVQNPDDQRILTKQRFIKDTQVELVRGSGVDLERFRATNIHGDPIVLMPTRLVHDKGIAVFIEAARILKTRGMDARFQIAGGITSHNPLAISQSEMEQMVAGTNVEWLGKISDMPALYASAIIIVYPSWYGEGIPRVLLEAAACGKPIITTDHPGCREAVTDNDNGFLVPVKNAQATADAIEKLLNDKALQERMGRRSRERAESEFDINLIARQTADIYKKL